jgi:Flp pilus assembly pilin Flp
MLVDMSGTWPERRQRHAVRLEASVTTSGGAFVASDVTDLSLDGCCLTGRFKIGELLQVKIPRNGVHSAEVRWSFLGRTGVRFLSACRNLAADRSGVAAIEYAIIISLIALALFGALFQLGGKVEQSFQQTNQAMSEGTDFNSV